MVLFLYGQKLRIGIFMKRELSLIVALMLFASVSCVFAEELNNESPKAIQRKRKMK